MDARVVVNAHELADIFDFEADTLHALAEAIALSNCAEDFVYREVEIDEVLRLSDFARRMPRTERRLDNVQLDRLRALLIDVWRQVTCDDPDAAAAAAAMAAVASEFASNDKD